MYIIDPSSTESIANFVAVSRSAFELAWQSLQHYAVYTDQCNLPTVLHLVFRFLPAHVCWIIYSQYTYDSSISTTLERLYPLSHKPREFSTTYTRQSNIDPIYCDNCTHTLSTVITVWIAIILFWHAIIVALRIVLVVAVKLPLHLFPAPLPV